MRFAGIILPLFFALGACHNLDEDTTQHSTLAVVSGTITNPQPVAVSGDNLRVAVVWDAAGQPLPDGSYAKDHRTSQDIKVSSAFPVSFTLKIAELPTELQTFAELYGATGNIDLRGTAGFVIAYEDTNRDGTLNLASASDTTFVDRVLGQSPTPILYLEGTMPTDPTLIANAKDASGKLPTLGFNLRVNYCASGKTPPAGAACEDKYDWMSVDTPVTLALSTDPKLADIMCQQIAASSTSELGVSHPEGELPSLLPKTGDPAVTCNADGHGFTLESCATTAPPGICQPTTTTCHEDHYSIAAGSSAPAGWPCTVH